MARKIRLVGRAYVVYRLRMMTAHHMPERYAEISDDVFARRAEKEMALSRFPKPYYSEDERDELCHSAKWWTREKVDAYMRRYIEPKLVAGMFQGIPGRPIGYSLKLGRQRTPQEMIDEGYKVHPYSDQRRNIDPDETPEEYAERMRRNQAMKVLRRNAAVGTLPPQTLAAIGLDFKEVPVDDKVSE